MPPAHPSSWLTSGLLTLAFPHLIVCARQADSSGVDGVTKTGSCQGGREGDALGASQTTKGTWGREIGPSHPPLGDISASHGQLPPALPRPPQAAHARPSRARGGAIWFFEVCPGSCS